MSFKTNNILCGCLTCCSMNTAGPWSPSFESIFFPFSVVSRGRNWPFVSPQDTSHCHYGFHIKYLFPFVPILWPNLCSEVRLANIKAPQMHVTSSDTGLRNANINTIYQITIVSHQDKKGWWWWKWFWGRESCSGKKRGKEQNQSQAAKWWNWRYVTLWSLR